MAEFTKEQLIAQAQENVKALKMASVQNAFKDIRPAIELDLRLAEIALAALTRGMEQEPIYQVQHGDQWRDLNKAQYDDHVNLEAEGLRIVYAAPQLPQPAVDDIGEIRVGRLPTMNQDEYPGLGDWWVQLRIGEDYDEVLARVYGATPQEANSRAEALASRAAMLAAASQQGVKSALAAGMARYGDAMQKLADGGD